MKTLKLLRFLPVICIILSGQVFAKPVSISIARSDGNDFPGFATKADDRNIYISQFEDGSAAAGYAFSSMKGLSWGQPDDWKKAKEFWDRRDYTSATQAFKQANVAAWARINYEYDQTPIYLVAKHTNSLHVDQLYQIVEQLQDQLDLSGFYVHKNDNNIAWLPTCVQKGKAVSFVIKQMTEEYGIRPIVGLGDSLSDMSFLNICHWFGMPNKGQLAKHVMNSMLETDR